METVQRSVVAKNYEGKMDRAEDFGDSENTLCDTIVRDTCHSFF